MVFKRYIKRHGKNLGPYYYQNVRHDGKIKSVYVGTNPMQHHRHRIRKPLFLLILALVIIIMLGSVLFFLQNGQYLGKNAAVSEPNFDVDQQLLKILIKSNEFLQKQVRVMNTGGSPIGIGMEIAGLSDIIKIDSKQFTIQPGQTKIVSLNFSSSVPEQNIEQQPGVYVGKLVTKSGKAAKEIPIVVEIESKNVLFDMNLMPVAKERNVMQGSETTIEVRVFNLESIDSANVDVEYFVKGMNGNTILTESETVVVKTQASFFKTISIPKNLRPGPYVFASEAKFGNSVGTASYIFEVTGPQAGSFVELCKNSVMCLGLSLTTLLLLFAITAYLYFFVGAYLYEKVTNLGRKKNEKSYPSKSVFEKVSDRLEAWQRRSEEKKLKKQRLEKEYESLRALEERRAQVETKRKQLEEWRLREEDLKLQEELRSQKELELKRSLEEDRLKNLQRINSLRKRKKQLQEFMHIVGLYRTPEEKKQIALQREKGRREKERSTIKEIKRKEELKKQKILERLRAREEREKIRKEITRKKEIEKIKQKEIETLEQIKKKEELNRQKKVYRKDAELQKAKRLQRRKEYFKSKGNQVKEFLKRLGVYRTEEEKKRIELQRRQYRENQEKERLMQLEAERKNKLAEEREESIRRDEEILRKQELRKKDREKRKARIRQLIKAPGVQLSNLMHVIGLSKTAKERRLISQQRKKEQGMKIKQAEEGKLRLEELRSQKELELKRSLEEDRLKNLQRINSLRKRKKQLQEFMHIVGLYRTPEEKKQIALQREKGRREKERSTIKEIKRKEELKKQKKVYRKNAELQKAKRLQRRKEYFKSKGNQVKEFLKRLGVYRTEEEKKRIELQRRQYRENQEKERLMQLEAERKNKLSEEREESIRRDEEILRKLELRKKGIEERKKDREKRKARIRQLIKAPGVQLSNLMHVIGLSKTAKERRLISQQRKKERDEKERLRNQKKVQEERAREEKIKREAELERQKQLRESELTRQREIERQKKEQEMKIKQVEEEKLRLGGLRKKEELENRTRELEEKRKASRKKERLNAAQKLESRLRQNKEESGQLHSELSKLESEKNIFYAKAKEIEAKASKAEQEIKDEYERQNKIKLQRNSLLEGYNRQIGELEKRQKEEKNLAKSKNEDLKAELSSKETELMKGMLNELQKIEPSKRKEIERWKRLEIKAKLKIEEQRLREELNRVHEAELDERKTAEYNYNVLLSEVNKNLRGSSKSIAGLKDYKKSLLIGNKSLPNDFARKSGSISKIKEKIEILNNEEKNIRAELKSPSLLNYISSQPIVSWIKGYRQKLQDKLKKTSGDNSTADLKKENKKAEEETNKKKELEKHRIEKEKHERDTDEKQKTKNSKSSEKDLEFEKSLNGKSKKVQKIFTMIKDAESLLSIGDSGKAKEVYLMARNIYIESEYSDKKEIYPRLMELHGKLSK